MAVTVGWNGGTKMQRPPGDNDTIDAGVYRSGASKPDAEDDRDGTAESGAGEVGQWAKGLYFPPKPALIIPIRYG